MVSSAATAEMASRELQRAVHEGDVAAIVRVLREHKADASVQCEGLDALCELTPNPGFGLQSAPVQAALEAGALTVAVAALRSHRARADVQLSACALLTRLAQGYAAEVGASGAVEAVVAGMRRNPSDAGLQVQACRLLHCLATAVKFPDSAAHAACEATAQLNARRAGDAGAVGAVVAALVVHCSTAGHGIGDFVNALFDLLRKTPENTRRALRAGALDACVVVLRAHVNTSGCLLEPFVVERFFLLMYTLLRHGVTNVAAAASRAGELGAVEAIVGVMRRQVLLFSDATSQAAFLVVECALSVLITLLDGHALNTERAWRAGALSLVQASLDAPGSSVQSKEVAELLVQRLSEFVADAEAAADAAAAELLAAEAPRPAAAMQHKKKGSKKKQHTAPPQRAAAAVDGASAAASEAPRSTCVICLDAQPCVVRLPCRHLPLCAAPACAAALRGLSPICREAVADTLTVHPS